MRLFTAVWPDAAAGADVEGRLARTTLDGWRPVASERRHVTLRFHGDDADPDALAAGLRAADLTRARALHLRCHGAGTFGTALWLGVEPDDPAGWTALLTAVGADPATHVAHLTVARARRAPAPDVPVDLPTAPGPWWPVTGVDLVASGSPYRTVARVAVDRAGAGKLRR